METAESDSEAAAIAFARHLANRAYESAYAMTSTEYRAAVSLEELRASFEDVIPPDWGEIGPITVVQTLQSWPQKRAADLEWVYVSIGGDVYSEALTIVVTSEGDERRVGSVEFGRP